LYFPHAGQAIQVTRRVRTPGSRRWRTVTVYAVTSLALGTASPAQLAGWLRGHWRIENRLHWVRDVTFGEDASTARTSSLPRVMASLRNLAVGALRLAGHPRSSPGSSVAYARAKPDPRVTALQVLPGIGQITAMTLVAEIGDIGRFLTARVASASCCAIASMRRSVRTFLSDGPSRTITESNSMR
jgi:Transposase IS116/IS110/IS902 family/Transposase DDE domain